MVVIQGVDRRLVVFGNSVLRRIFRPKRDENGEWRKLISTNKLNKVRAIKSRRLRWAANVTRMKESRSAFKILTENPIVVVGRTIFEWILKR